MESTMQAAVNKQWFLHQNKYFDRNMLSIIVQNYREAFYRVNQCYKNVLELRTPYSNCALPDPSRGGVGVLTLSPLLPDRCPGGHNFKYNKCNNKL